VTLPDGPLLLLAPHFDDAALSCAALLEREAPIDVVTVFAGGPEPPRQGWWDELCGFGGSEESLPARKAEERAAIGERHRLSFLPLLDMQYVEGRRGSADAETIVAAVTDWAMQTGGGHVAIPAGAGVRKRLLRRSSGIKPHPDHVLVRDAVLEARPPGVVPLLYEELPYASGGAPDGLRAEPFTVPVDPVAKARRVALYASQLRFLEGLHEPENVPPHERYWMLGDP
jgi:LmbE family N-acetylglucosaminyl deacetylase